MKSVAHAFAQPATWRAFLCFGLNLVGFWACDSVASAFVGARGSLLTNFMNVICFAAITLVTVRCPTAFRNAAVSSTVLLLAPFSVVLFVLLPSSFPLPLAVVCLLPLFFSIGWMGVLAGLSFIKVDRSLVLFLMVVAYLASHALQTSVRGMEGLPALVLSAVVPAVVFFLSRPNVMPLLNKYTASTSPAELLAVSPSAFVPFGSKFFVSLVLFGMVYGFAQYGISEEVFSLWPLSFVPLLVLVGYLLVCRAQPTADFLFLAASLTLIAALLLSLSVRAGVPVELAAAGSELCDLFFYCFAIILVGSRSRLAVLPILAWGRTASAFGMTAGAALALAVPPLHASLPLVTGIVAFLFISYALVIVRRFDFDEIANKLEPIRVVLAPDQTKVEIDVPSIVATYGLTQREAEVFALLARGRNGKVIEEELTVSRNTVKTHIRNIYSKLGVHSQQELIDLAEQHMMAG